MPELIPLLGKSDIENLVAQIAKRISSDYQDRELVLIGILNGAFIFLSDLVRYLSVPVEIDFIGTSSYQSGTVSSGNIRLTKSLDIDIKNKDVLVIEDIVDTGLTVDYCMDYLRSFSPKTLKICAMIEKFERRNNNIVVDYACYEVKEGFLVGYGLDYDQKYRELPGIYMIKK